MDYTIPDKLLNGTWSADEHNQMKAAVNSKMDKSMIVSDIDSPLATEAISASYIALFNRESIRYRGTVNSTSDLKALTVPGFWTASAAGSSWHASFPGEMPTTPVKCGLLVYAQGDSVVQELTLYLTDPRVFKRVCDGPPSVTGSWKNWVEYTTISRARDEFAPRVIDAVPSVTLPGETGFTVTKSATSRDMGGRLTIANVSSNPKPTLSISVNFGSSRQKILAVILTPGNDVSRNDIWSVDSFDPGGFTATIGGQFNPGQTSVFNYCVILNS